MTSVRWLQSHSLSETLHFMLALLCLNETCQFKEGQADLSLKLYVGTLNNIGSDKPLWVSLSCFLIYSNTPHVISCPLCIMMDPWHPNTHILLETKWKMSIKSLRNMVQDDIPLRTHALSWVYSFYNYYWAGSGSQSLSDDIYTQ